MTPRAVNRTGLKAGFALCPVASVPAAGPDVHLDGPVEPDPEVPSVESDPVHAGEHLGVDDPLNLPAPAL